jgi:hypothetical protein
MVEVRATRLAAEVLAGEGTSAGVTRLDAQVAAATDGTAEVRATRLCAEVLSSPPPSGSVTRLDAQIAAATDGTAEVRATRLAAEVLAQEAKIGTVTRLDAQIAAATGGTAEVRATRLAAEVLAREGASRSVAPLDLADDAYLFLHNWVTRSQMVSSFLTDVTFSPDSGAESRRGLGARPAREVSLEWLIADDDIELERFEVLLRRMTEGRFQVPIYMDQVELAAGYDSADTALAFDTTRGRWFDGGRIAIVQLDASNQVESISWHLIDSLDDSNVYLSAALGADVAAGSLVFPIMDCEAILELEVEFITARVARFTLEAAEAPGPSQLPALKADTPSGFDTLDGAPVWTEQPDWTSPVNRGRLRYGSVATDARAPFVDLQANRGRVTHDYVISGERADIWPAVEFFETRRGQLRSWWHADLDSTFTPINIDATGGFVSVSVLGDLTDFDQEFDHVAVVMVDGTVYARAVDNIQLALGVFRITPNTNFPAGLALSDIARVCRLRRTRFAEDSLVEVWTHTNYCEVQVSVVETLDEQNYES